MEARQDKKFENQVGEAKAIKNTQKAKMKKNPPNNSKNKKRWIRDLKPPPYIPKK